MPSADEREPSTVALIGNPNTGKSTLFSGLVGVHQRVGNYPGVTVEKKTGHMACCARHYEVVDLPGLYSLSPRSLDEMVAVDLLLGRSPDAAAVDAVICIVDASNLERNLYLVCQVFELGLPTLLALNMLDVARDRGVSVDAARLQRQLGIPVVPIQANRRIGLAELKNRLGRRDRRSTAPIRQPVSPGLSRRSGQLARLGRVQHGWPAAAAAALPDRAVAVGRRRLAAKGDPAGRRQPLDATTRGGPRAAGGRRLRRAGRGDPGPLPVGARKTPRRCHPPPPIPGNDHRSNRPRADPSLLGHDRLRPGNAAHLPFRFRLGRADHGVDRRRHGGAGRPDRVAHGRGSVAKPVDRRRDSWRRRRAGLSPPDHDPLLVYRRPGRLRLHGQGRVSDGPLDGSPGSERQVVHPLALLVCLRDSRNHGGPGDRGRARPPGHDPDRPADDLLRAPAGLRPL